MRWTGQVSLQNDPMPLFLDHRVGDRNGREQGLRVRVQGVAVQRVTVRQLHDLAQIHDSHAVTDVPHHAQVVCDEDVSQPQPVLQIFQKVDDLGLNRNVQCGNRLIADDQIGVQGQRAGQTDTLSLPPGELVWVPAHHLRVQADQLQQFRHPLLPLLAIGQMEYL